MDESWVEWLLTKHLKEVHGLVVKKAKPKRPSTSVGGLRNQDHGKMNARICQICFQCTILMHECTNYE